MSVRIGIVPNSRWSRVRQRARQDGLSEGANLCWRPTSACLAALVLMGRRPANIVSRELLTASILGARLT
jgi:hypothetical protein